MEFKQEMGTFVNEFEPNVAGNDGFKKDMTNTADDTVMMEKEDKLGHPDDLDQNSENTDGPVEPEATPAFIEDGFSDDEDSSVPLSHELQQGLRILKELMADSNKSVNWHFMDPVDSNHPETMDYYDRIKNPVWFRKMKDKFDSKEYESITEFVADFRLMLENCYRYNGPDHYVSKRGQKLETMMEQKLALLSRELREKTSITATSGQQLEDNSGFGNGLRRRTRTIIPHDSSVLLNQLREEELQREREARKLQMSERKAAQEAALQDIMDWEDNIMGGKKIEMKAMWEIPQIGHFLFLCQEQLNVGEITQFELERCFYMPRESSTMQKVMTSLLSTPFQRLKIDRKTMMPYKVWDEKLRIKLRHWYKIFADGFEDANKAADKLGLDPHFYRVVGRKNPLEKRKFHEINVYRRVWIVKSLCDYCLEHQESLREAIENQPIEEQHDYLVGVDAEGNRYLHFPQFCGADLRIYKQKKIPEPKLLVTSSPTKAESPKLKLKDPKPEPVKEDSKKEKSRSGKKKKKKPDIPLPPTNRPSRLRQKIKTVIPVQTYSSSDEDDVVDSDSSTENYSEDQSDIHLNDSGICEESPKKKPKNKNIGQLIENDNQSDTSSMDGEASWKRKPTSRLVRNGLMRELKNVSEISMDESSVDKDETLSEKSFALDTDSCNIDDSNLGSSNPKDSGYNDDKEMINFSKCVKDLDKNVDGMEVDSDEDDTTSEKTKEFFKGLANTNIEREMSPYENDIDYDSPCTEGFEANDIEMNTLFNDVKASEEFSNDSLGDRVNENDDASIKLELDECNNKSNSTGDKICDKDKNESMLDKFDKNSKAAKQNNEMEVEIKVESDKFACEIELEKEGNKTIKQEINDGEDFVSHIGKSDEASCKSAIGDTSADSPCQTVVKMESTCDDLEEDNSQKASTGVSGGISIKQEKLEDTGASHDHDYGLEIKSEAAQKKLDHDYGHGCYADIGEGDSKENDEKTDIKQEEEEEEDEEEEEIAPDLTEFELIVESVEDLRVLVESFAEQEPVVIGKGKKQKIIKPPPRKKCVTELHGRLLFLLKELEPWEQKLLSAAKKARLKLRKEHIGYEESTSQESSWELEKEKESSSSDSEEENSDSGESDEGKSTPTNYINMTENEPVVKTESQEENLEFDVSSRGRIRKRRVIPNNSEDQGSAKKKKPNLVTSSSPVVPHVPAILQRQGKVVLPSNILASSQATVASQILLQTSSGNQIQLAGQGSTQPAANVRLLTGNTLVQPQQWASLLQKTAQQSQIRSPMSVKQASHPVIQQLLSTRQPAPSNVPNKLSTYQPGTASAGGLKLSKGNAVAGAQKPGNTQQTATIQLTNTTQPGKVQYYAANINSLPPAVVQQLVKSNALKFPAGGNQSGMVLLTTVNPQSSQGAIVQGSPDSIGVRSKIQPQSRMLRLPIATAGSRIRLPQAQAAQLQQQVSTVIPSLELEENTSQTATTAISVPSTNVLSGFNVALSPLLNKNTSAVVGNNLSVNVSNPKIDNVMITTSLPDTIATINTKVSTAVGNTTSPNKISQKYANNVTVKTLLESRKPPVSAVSLTTSSIASVSATSTSVAEKPRVTSVLHNTPKGIKAVKIPCQAVLDLAVKTVVTSVKTSLPTANIKVPSPTTMPSLTPRRNVTKTIQSMKAPIPTTPTVESISASSSSSVVTQTISPSVSSVSMTSSPSLTTVIPNQNILAQLQSGNGGQIILTNVNKSVLGNVASQQQDQTQKTSMLKFLPQNLQSSQGVVQGYLTPQGLIIPQTALQQQQTSLSPQLLSQQGVQNPVIQQYNLTSPKPTSTSQISSIGGSQFVLPHPVLPQGTVAGANSISHVGQKYVPVLGNYGANDSSKSLVSWVNSNNQSNVLGTIPATEGIGTNVKAFSNVSASINTQPVLGTDTSSTGANSQVKMSVVSLNELSTVKETVGNVSKLGNPTVSSYYVPTLNMVNVDNKGNPVSLAVAAHSSVVSKPLAAPVAAYGGQLYPIVTVAGAPMANLGTSVSGPLTPVSPSNPLVPHSPSINVPQSPVQLTSPLLGQLTSPVANVGNIATVLGQLTAPLGKTTILGQQGGNIQLLGQQAGAVGANATQILGLPTQVNIPISSTSNVIGQQLNVAGAASASQIIGQPLTSPVPKQAPSLVLGNIGQGSSSDLMKQLAAAQLLGSSQLHLTGLQAGSSSVTPSISSRVVSGQQQLSNSSVTKPVQNQILLQLPTSPTGQSVVRPSPPQAGQAMLVLSPPKRMLSGNAGVSGPTPSKQLSLQLNAPTATSVQQITGTVAVNSAAKKLQPVLQKSADTGVPKVPFSATKPLKTSPAPLQLSKNTAPFRAEANAPSIKGFQAAVTKPGTVIPKTTVSFVEGQNIASLKTVLTSSQNKPEVTTNTGEKTSQKLFLYNINGQLFTPQGVPVTVENGVLKVLPQSKSVAMENGMLKVLPQAKSVQATSVLAQPTTSEASDPPVTIVKSPVSLIPPHVLTNQQQKRVLISPKFLQSGESQSPAYLLTTNTGLVTAKLPTSSMQTSLASVGKAVDSTQTVSGINTKASGSTDFASAQGQITGIKLSTKTESAVSSSGDLTQKGQIDASVTNPSQMLAGGVLNINQMIAQHSPMAQQLTTSLNTPSSSDKQNVSLQVKGSNQSPGPTGATGQGYIVMPNTAGQTQIIFPQANLNAAALSNAVKAAATSNVVGNASTILSNVKLVKAADMAKTLTKYSASAAGGDAMPNVVQSPHASKMGDSKAVKMIPDGGTGKTAVVMEKSSEMKTNSKVPLSNFVISNHGKVGKYSAADMPVASHSMHVDQRLLKQKSSCADGPSLAVISANNDIPNGLASITQDSSVPYQNSKEGMKQTLATENGHVSQASDPSEPKGAEKEEAALNLLSLANQAF